jgi:hypothetical protein
MVEESGREVKVACFVDNNDTIPFFVILIKKS